MCKHLHTFVAQCERNATRNEMGNLNAMTVDEIRAKHGKKPRTFQIAWGAMGNANYDKHREVSQDEITRANEYYARLRKGRTVREKSAKSEQKEKPILLTKPAVSTEAPPVKKMAYDLYAVLIVSTAASVYNVLKVCIEIADIKSAILLTTVFSIAAVVFVRRGIKNWLTWGVVGVLVAFEGICNAVMIYGGLTLWEIGLPTSFLAGVTDFFNTGTYGTARAIASVAAILIAAVQYASIFEINKSK